MSESPAANPAAPPSRLTIRAILRTDVGKVRSENQDFGTMTVPGAFAGSARSTLSVTMPPRVCQG